MRVQVKNHHVDIAQALAVEEDGRVALRVAMTATLYWSTAEAGIGGRTGALIDRFWPLLAPRVRAYQTTTMKRSRKLDSRAQALISEVRSGTWDGASFETIIIDDRASEDEAAANGITLTAAPYRGVGYVEVKVSPDFSHQEFRRLLLEGTQGMPYLHGFAGFGLVYNDMGDLATTADGELFALGMRHLGLDLQSALNTSFCAPSGFKCVNWLTWLGDGLATRLSPPASVGVRGSLHVSRQEHGIVVQAGDAPCIGDINRGDDCAAYREAGRWLAPVRSPDHPAFIMDERLPLASRERTERWLSRFDL